MRQRQGYLGYCLAEARFDREMGLTVILAEHDAANGRSMFTQGCYISSFQVQSRAQELVTCSTLASSFKKHTC